jgi:hypothetical protein
LNIRELARREGGEALVAKIDKAQEIEKQAFTRLSMIGEEVLEGCKEDPDAEQVALAALCEAYSMAYANIAAIITMKSFGGNRAEGILVAVRSVSGNITQAFDTLDASKANISEAIKAAAAKAMKGSE